MNRFEWFGARWTPALLGAFASASCGGNNNDSGGGADTMKPTVTLTAPANLSDDLNGSLDIAASASDNAGVAGVRFEVDGISAGPEDAAAPYGVRIDTSAYTAGQHVLRARARDAEGNLSDWSSVTVRFGGSRTTPQGFTKDESWLTGLSSATAFTQAADGRMFVAQQGGALGVVKNGSLLSTPFLQVNVDPNGERGLLGVALHPDFTTNRFVYIYYTTPNGGTHNRISRFVASLGNGDVSTGVETVLVELPALSTATNHNGGAIHFASDGKLYVGVGDNADGLKSQDLSDPFGKLLRFNDDGSVPSDNPHFNTATNDFGRAVWAHGLRNPFTFAIQPGTGRMHINDVGANTWEEIDVGTAGANYGWPASEGPDAITAGMTAPLFAYKHTGGTPPGSGPGGFFTGFAIAGGAFYPDTGNFPAGYRGSYFFADFSSRWIGRLTFTDGVGASDFARVVADSPVDMLVGSDGALYVLTRFAITRISAN